LQLTFRNRTPSKLAASTMTELRALDNMWQELDQAPRGPSAAQLSQYLKQVHITAWISDTRQHTLDTLLQHFDLTIYIIIRTTAVQAPCCTRL
jgi:hypothetical protein